MHRHITPPMIWRMAAALAVMGGIGGAGAMPAAPVPTPASALPASPTGPGAAVELAANGCGPGFFRTTAGQCFPNRRFVGPYGGVHTPPPCPPGYLRAPNRPLCFPVGR